jgi:hypothetical protein
MQNLARVAHLEQKSVAPEAKPKPGPVNLFNMTTKRLTMKGLIVGDWLPMY